MQIAIVGAGIGGLTSALCLAQSGHEITLYEKATAFSEVGAGIQCGANACAILDYLGLLDAVLVKAVEPNDMRICHYSSGDVLYQSFFGKSYQQAYQYPYLHVHRADLHSILLTACELHPNINVFTNSHVVSFEQSKNKVDIQLELGSHYTFDLLVAADGIHSGLRARIFQQMGLSALNIPKCHYYAWRGVIDAKKMKKDSLQKSVYNFVGKQKHLVAYYLRNQTLVNFVGVVKNTKQYQQTHLPTASSWLTKGDWQELQADFAGWHETVSHIVSQVNRSESYRWPLFEYPHFPTWHTQRVVLLGDAAHPTLPYMASGAAMAMEDAVILQRCLNDFSTVEQSINCYVAHRKPRVKKVQTLSHKAGKLYHMPNQYLKKITYQLMQKSPYQAESFLPKYNALTERL